MKPTTLTQAVLTSLTAITLTACGGGDDGGAIYGVQDNSTPIVPTITPTVTPNPAPAAPDFVALAKQAGLNDANAELFAQNAKHLAVDSADFQDALVQAIKAQQADNAIKQNTVIDPIAKPVDTANPFINGVDVSKQPTMGSSHYVRQMGSNYERTANPEAMAGLGAVATDDPTKSNPWLSNYVLGVEAIRDGDGSVKVVAIDSTGEMAVSAPAGNRFNPTNENEGATLGQMEQFTSGLGTSMNVARGLGNSQLSPYVINNGLIYTTQRGGGGSFKYNYARNNRTEDGTDNGVAGNAYSFVITIQKQNATHRDETSQLDADNALSIAKYQIPSPYPANTHYRDDPQAMTSPFNKHAAVGLLVYNKYSKNVAHQKGKELGYKKPIYGKEENVYMLNEDTNEYEVINGVGIEELDIPRTDRPNRWYGSRYGSWEMLRENNDSRNGVKSVIKDNSTVASAITNGSGVFVGRKVANNDGAHIYGKNFVSLDAGAEGKQIKNNTYTAKYKVDGTLGKIAPDKLHNVQYGRLTNNIDILALSEFDNHTGQPRIIYRQFQTHGAPNTVDTYFYRGTNHTTMDEMASIKARGGTYRYHGHALTYNLGPYVNTAPVSTGGIPTAYGSSVAMSSGTTIGNFVEATFDAGKGKVTGSIYNFLNKEHSNKDEDFKKQDLATFKGDVFGNTVVGTSAKVGTNEVGSFTGSFFGQGASELGGNISSISREQGYGDAKWGAVFGATRGTVVDNYNVVEQ